MVEENMYNKLRQKSWDKAHDAIGYSFIFSKRMNKMSGRIRALTTMGIIVPVAASSIVYAYYHNQEIVAYTVLIATPIGIAQFLLSLFSIIYKWDDNLAYAIEATAAHSVIADKYRKLANTPPETFSDLKTSYDLLEIESTERAKQDAKQGIKPWELRMGMRAALRELQRKCVGCNTVPLSLESTKCHVCGNYSFTYKILNK